MNMMQGLPGMGEGGKLMAKLDEILDKQSKLEDDVAELKGTGGGGATASRKKSMWKDERSLSRKSKARMNVIEAGELAPVLFGDYIVLQDLSSTPGFVTGDPAFRRCGVQKLNNDHKVSSEYDNYVFQVFPALVYRSKQEIKQKKLARTGSITSVRRSSSTLKEEKEAEEKLLVDRAEHEDKLNQNTINDVLSGERRDPLRYGQLIQLLHVKSGCFISCHHTAALRDPSCRKISLREGGIAAQFALLPCFKAQTEGSVVFYTHSIKLGSVKLNGMYLHSSDSIYEDVVDSTSETLPRCLRTEIVYELNASAKFSIFVLKKFGSFEPGSQVNMKGSFSPFRLYHSQSESFVTASCNADKNIAGQVRQVAFKKESGAEDESFPTELPLHIPYLRNIEHATGEEPDPTDQRNHITKSVWVFESLTRTTSSTIGWGEPVRIRHLPSGKYLCVDISAPTHSVPPAEKWYRTYLVDEPTEDTNLIENGEFGEYCSSEQAVFRVECDGAAMDQIPLHDSNVRVEFRAEHSPLRLFLHNAEVNKPRHSSSMVSDERKHSLMLVFSTQRSAQDTLKLMPISEEESLATFRGKAFIAPALAYATNLANVTALLPSVDKLQETMHCLIGIIAFQSRGTNELSTTDNWIKIANSMLPSAFSALFDGEPSALTQRISRDLKLMDAVFAMGLAPYQRFTDPFPREETEGPRGIQKLVHVALQRMFANNTYCQLYFGRRTASSGKLLQGAAKQGSMPWIEIIKLQLEDPLGSAVTLSKLLSSNGELLEEHATPNMVQEFARMIKELGPQPRLVNFFEAICASGKNPVKSNQEMILRMTWRLEEERSKLYLELESVPNNIIKKFGGELKEYPKVMRLPGGDMNNGTVLKTKPPSAAAAPDNFLGKEEYVAKFPPVFIRWSGIVNWKQKMENSLFWSPSDMVNLRVIDFNGRQLVRLEDFCWVLEPARLCESVTGEKWSDFCTRRESTQEGLKERFQRQEQLAQYFVAEMKMLSMLCFGRSYNCIAMLEKSFPYTMLISMIQNEHLPSVVRAVTLDITRVLYLDRFPQMTNCARPSIPEMLWVYEAPDMSPEDLLATPVIQNISLLNNKKNAPLALPCFQIPESHKLSGYKDPLYSFPNHFKFYLLRTAANDVIHSFASGRIDHNNRQMNQLASATVSVISNLLSFGFQSSYEKIHALVKGLVRLLDGRTDVQKLTWSDNDEDPEETEFDPFKKRFELSTNSPGVTSIKVVILDVLIAVSDFRTQFRLGKMMHIFKTYTEERKPLTQLKVFHNLVSQFKEKTYEGSLTDELYTAFEALFTQGDGKMLDFEVLSNQPLNTILLDCLMYHDDNLHAKALEMLERTFTQRKRLIEAVKDVILLHRAPYYAQLNAEIGYLVYLLRSTEVWAISSRIAGKFDDKKKAEFFEMCSKVTEYMHKVSAEVDMKDGKSKMADVSGEQSLLLSNIVGGFGTNLLPLNTRDSVSTKSKLQTRLSDAQGHNGRSTVNGFGNVEMSPMMMGVVDDDDDEDDGKPVFEHQEVLRAMNLQLALTMALNIDYNLAFKGSICTAEDKIISRNTHIEVMRKVVEMLIDFVSHNEKNQDIIFAASLGRLRYHMGDLKSPIIPQDFETNINPMLKQGLVTQPGLNTEAVIIECLKGNVRICSEEVPRALFDEFGKLLNAEPECSESRLLEFFNIVIVPQSGSDPLFRNQESTLEVLLSPKNVNLRRCMEGCFDINGEPLPSKPQNIVNILSACIMNQNGITSSRLQAYGYSIDASIAALSKCLNRIQEMTQNPAEQCVFGEEAVGRGETTTLEERIKREQAILLDEHFTSLVLFLSHQLRCLVIDPRLYRQHDMWRVLTDAVGLVISGFARDLANPTGATFVRVKKYVSLIIPALRVIHDFVKGAKQMGAGDAMITYEAPLKGDPRTCPDSIYACMKKIWAVLGHNRMQEKMNQPAELLAIQEVLLVSVRKLQYELVPSSQEGGEDEVHLILHQHEDVKLESTKTLSRPLLGRRASLEDNDGAATGAASANHVNLEMEAPSVLLSYFVEALTHNPMIQDKLQARKYEFLDVLENAHKLTCDQFDKDEEEDEEEEEEGNLLDPFNLMGDALEGMGAAVNAVGDAANMVGDAFQNAIDVVTNQGAEFPEPLFGVKISWEMIIDRLVEFANAHNFDKDESNLIRVHTVLKNHILKARSIGPRVLETSDGEMTKQKLEMYRAAQSKLDAKGVTRAALVAIATHTAGVRDTAAVSAMALLQELLYSGNTQVQTTVLYYIEHVDKDSRLLKHIRARLQESTRIVKERGEQVRNGFIPMSRDHRAEYEEAEQTLHLLSEMMEGHNFALQNIIRTQPLQSADVDLLKMVFDLLDFQASQSHLLRNLCDGSVGLLTSTMDFIVESMQGPCDGNQLALVKSEATMAAVKNILQSNFHHRLTRPVQMRLKSKAILVIAASLEGRKDRLVHDFLAEQLEISVLNKFASDATFFITLTQKGEESWNSKESEQRDLCDEALQGLVALANIKTEMNLVESFAAAERLANKESSVGKKGNRRHKVEAEVRMMRSSVASVEVLWNDRVEFVSFPLPLQTDYLSAGSKSSFLEHVDLSTHEKRMKELIRAAPFLTAEMHQVYSLAKKSSVYKFMHQNFNTIKSVQYALVLLLNLNIVMASYGRDKETEVHGKEDLGYSSAFSALFGDGMQKQYRTSLLLTFVLGIPNFLGYFFIMAFMGITEVPIVIRLIDNNIEEKKAEALTQQVQYRDPAAFTWWGVTLVFNIVFIIQHQAAYPNDKQPALYLFLIFGVNLPWTLICIRNWILVADSPTTRYFCIGFDTLVTKPFFRNQTLLVFCSINGFRFSSYFTLMLLDVVNISPTIQSLVKSVTTPAPQLGIVAYLFVIMVIIFASFGLDFFEDFFTYDADYEDDADDLTGPNPYGCHSVVACFWLIMYKGVPSGSLDGVLDVIDNRDPQYLGRVAFDLSFFVIVGIFLFNIITGLMVDTFSALREEAAARADLLNNECYVCGFTRTAYDDIGMLSPSFDQHKDKSHYIWNYLYFIQYLQEKDQTEFSGVESYVFNMLQTHSQDWLPARTSFAAQNYGISHDDDTAQRQMENRLTAQIEASFDRVDKKFADIELQMNKMGEKVQSS